MLHQTISKAFCINLYYRQDRWIKAQKQFAREGLNVERFNAIDGRECAKQYPIRPGNLGCNMSHYLVIMQAKLMGFNAVLIFEDDVVLCNDFTKKVSKCIADLPEEWHILMLGANHIEKPTVFTENLYKVNKAFTTHGYIIHSRFYDFILNQMMHFEIPMDELLAIWQRDMNVFVTNPVTAWQEAGFSDIEGRVMNYEFIRTSDSFN